MSDESAEDMDKAMMECDTRSYDYDYEYPFDCEADQLLWEEEQEEILSSSGIDQKKLRQIITRLETLIHETSKDHPKIEELRRALSILEAFTPRFAKPDASSTKEG